MALVMILNCMLSFVLVTDFFCKKFVDLIIICSSSLLQCTKDDPSSENFYLYRSNQVSSSGSLVIF